MQRPVGHERCLAALEAQLPEQPVLLLGPESTGKWAKACWLAQQHASPWDCWMDDRPAMDRVRQLREFLIRVPSASPGGRKVVAVNLDGAKSAAVQHALLKELEEPPDYARFILVASRAPLPTIASRCIIWRLGRLSDDEVARVLVREGISEKQAQAAAPAGQGRVAPALAAAENLVPAKRAVLGVLRAVAVRDRDALERSVKGWGASEDWLLRELLGEAASGRSTELFTGSERQVISRTEARRALTMLSLRVRPVIAVRMMAARLMEGR